MNEHCPPYPTWFLFWILAGLIQLPVILSASPDEAPEGILFGTAPAAGPLVIPGSTYPDLIFSTPGGKAAFFTESFDIELTDSDGGVQVYGTNSQGPEDWLISLTEERFYIKDIDIELTGGALKINGGPVATLATLSFSGAAMNGSDSAAFGTLSSAPGTAAFALGESSIAKGNRSFAGGLRSETGVAASTSFAFGYEAKAKGESSIALGDGVVADGSGQLVCGAFNLPIAEAAFIVGNGGQTPGQTLNVLDNPSFENGLTDWDTWNTVQIETTDVYHQQNSARLVGQSQLTQTQSVVIGETYSFSGYYKTEGSSTWLDVAISFWDSNGNQIGGASDQLNQSSSWTTFLVQSEAPVGATSVVVAVYCDNGGELLVDQLRLEEQIGESSLSNAFVVMKNGDSEINGDLKVEGEADIARVPPKGGISMGSFTDQ